MIKKADFRNSDAVRQYSPRALDYVLMGDSFANDVVAFERAIPASQL
jgi:hypothetical protein